MRRGEADGKEEARAQSRRSRRAEHESRETEGRTRRWFGRQAERWRTRCGPASRQTGCGHCETSRAAPAGIKCPSGRLSRVSSSQYSLGSQRVLKKGQHGRREYDRGAREG